MLPAGLRKLDLSWNKIGAEGVKALVLPPGLQKLSLNYNNIGAEGAKGLVLPPGLQELHLYNNNIGDEKWKGLKLPRTSNTNPQRQQNRAEGAKALVLPPRLQALNLWFNNIGAKGAKGLVLPPRLRALNIKRNNINNKSAKGLVLPPSVKEIHTGSRSTDIFLLNKFAKPEHKYEAWNRYIPYLLQYELPLRKEICRGLIFGHTENPIFQFLQSTYGSKHIRRMILEYYCATLII